MPLVRILLGGGAFVALAALACAQDVGGSFKQVAPKTLPSVSLPPPPANGPMPDQGGDESEILPHLRGLVIVGDPKDLEKKGGDLLPRKADGKIRFISGVTEADQKNLRPILETYLDKSVSMESLNEVLRDIVLYYRGKDHPIVDAYLPEQTLVDDVVQIVVTESKLGKVTVEGEHWFPASYYMGQVRTASGQPIVASRVNADIDWLNRNPFLSSELVYQAGEAPGTTDIVLKSRDRLPIRFYTGYEDSGNTLTGQGRFEGGFNWGNAFGLGDQFNYQYLTSPDLQLLRAHSASYIHYLPWHHLLTVFGSYADTKADFPSLDDRSSGSAWQTSMRYTIPLKPFTAPGWTYNHEVDLGYDFKESTSDVLFNVSSTPGTQRTATDVSQFVLGYDGSLGDPWGSTSFTATGYYSPGGMTQANTTTRFLGANSSSASYTYGHFTMNRVQKLPWNLSLIVKAAYQVADARLIPSEQMGLGGYDTVRGYDDREANGDNGYLISGEVRTPPTSVLKIFGREDSTDQLQFLGFMDYGGVSQYGNSDETLGTPLTNANINMWGVGPGLRYAFSPYVSVRFDYGWQLMDSDVPYEFREHQGSRGHLSIVISY